MLASGFFDEIEKIAVGWGGAFSRHLHGRVEERRGLAQDMRAARYADRISAIPRDKSEIRQQWALWKKVPRSVTHPATQIGVAAAVLGGLGYGLNKLLVKDPDKDAAGKHVSE